MRAVVLCDAGFGGGPVQAAIDYLTVERRYQVVGAAVIGAAAAADFELDVPIVAAADAAGAVRRAVAAFAPRAIVDVTASAPDQRLSWANEALGWGVEVHGADFRMWPPPFKPAGGRPAVAFIGNARGPHLLAALRYFLGEIEGRRRAAVVMLRWGGPPYAEVVEAGPAAERAARALGAYRDGRDIAAEHYVLAAAAGVTAVGCSFAGTGFTGVPLNSVVADGVLLAAEGDADVIVLGGAYPAIPPAAAGAVCFVVELARLEPAPASFALSYQLRRSDVVVATAYTPTPGGSALGRLQGILKGLGVRAPVCYGALEPAWVGELPAGDAVVVTARPPEGRRSLAPWWNKRLKGRVAAVIPAGEMPSRAAAARLFRRGGERLSALLDLAAPNVGPWLAAADAAGAAVTLTCETLQPGPRLAARLLPKLGLTAARRVKPAA
jgi:hypothetical protein